jgi:choice-of-anchor A domain-containing protein
MKSLRSFLPLLALMFTCTVSYADSLTFGAASAYNLVALGTVDSSGHTVIAGNIGTQADIQGRIAAANLVTVATTIGSNLSKDPFGASTNYAIVAGAGISASNSFNINGGGNVYDPNGGGRFNFNESPRGSVVSTGASPINFGTLRTSLQAESLRIAAMLSNGVVGAPTPVHGNPSWLVLSGTSTTLNVFTLTAAQFADTNHPIDIEVPLGSTVIINVNGTNVTLGAGIYFRGVQESDSNNDNGDLLFNFASSATVTINGQFDGALLAPFAILTGGSQMGGTFIAAQIGQTGEVHNLEFVGTIPDPTAVTPEPGSLTLLGTGALALAGMMRRKFLV